MSSYDRYVNEQEPHDVSNSRSYPPPPPAAPESVSNYSQSVYTSRPGDYSQHPFSDTASTYSRSLYAPRPTYPGSSIARDRTPSPFEDNPPYTHPYADRLTANPRFYQDDNPPSTSTYDENRNPFESEDAIPLQTQQNKNQSQFYTQPYGHESAQPLNPVEDPEGMKQASGATVRKRRRKILSWQTPWFIYTLTLIQVAVFIGELVKNASLTGSPIMIHPQFNPMVGPSPYVTINMGARYVPCMRNQAGIQNASETLLFPCPNQTTTIATCSLSELCGFSGIPPLHVDGSLDQKPAADQWYRFIIPIFLHAGIIHIGFNMLLQIMLGAEMERAIGAVRVALVYFPSGIFGFIMGANFAPSGISSTGASGALFGIIALLLLDLLYTWKSRPNPWRDLAFIILDSVVSFVLGLLPGVDNFSHIGGFIMGLIIGLCLLRSPNALRQRIGDTSGPDYALTGAGSNMQQQQPPKQKEYKLIYSDVSNSKEFFSSPRSFFQQRKPLWWAWWLVRAGALVLAIVLFIVLLNNFYAHHSTTCSWCKYLSCLPVKNWCDIGDLTFNNQTTTSSSSSSNPNFLFNRGLLN